MPNLNQKDPHQEPHPKVNISSLLLELSHMDPWGVPGRWVWLCPGAFPGLAAQEHPAILPRLPALTPGTNACMQEKDTPSSINMIKLILSRSISPSRIHHYRLLWSNLAKLPNAWGGVIWLDRTDLQNKTKLYSLHINHLIIHHRSGNGGVISDSNMWCSPSFQALLLFTLICLIFLR